VMSSQSIGVVRLVAAGQADVLLLLSDGACGRLA
jgi:hypothetical protein